MTRNSTIRVHVAMAHACRLMRAKDHCEHLNPAQWQALRYISCCNRFSNTPAALGAWLAATKGTVSQTLSSLARKGLIEKRPRKGGGLSLALTEAGLRLLEDDPAGDFLSALDGLRPEERKYLSYVFEKVLMPMLAPADDLSCFGPCRACRHFVRRGAPEDPEGPHYCEHFAAALSKAESRRICAFCAPQPE